AGCSALVLTPLWMGSLSLVNLNPGTWTSPVLVLRLVLLGGALAASWGVFCRDGRLAFSRLALLANAEAVFWLSFRQGRLAVLLLAVAGFWAGLLLPSFGVLVWPVLTLLIGAACGSAAFGGEQAGESARYLGDQR